jgi:uncharacterized protein
MNNKMIHMIAFVLMAVGAINWGLVGLLDINLVETILGKNSLTNIVYILVGASAVYILIGHKGDCKVCSGKK